MAAVSFMPKMERIRSGKATSYAANLISFHPAYLRSKSHLRCKAPIARVLERKSVCSADWAALQVLAGLKFAKSNGE